MCGNRESRRNIMKKESITQTGRSVSGSACLCPEIVTGDKGESADIRFNVFTMQKEYCTTNCNLNRHRKNTEII